MFDEFLQTHDLGAMLLKEFTPFPPRSDRASWLGLPEYVRERLLRYGDVAKQGYPLLTATQFMVYARTGVRQVYEKPYFERRRRLLHAVLAECVADDGSYVDAIIDGLWCICEETSWVISAHNGSSHPGSRPASEHPLPDVQNPYIDLFCAQTAATLCYALYFVGDKLDAVTPIIARRVRLEMENRIFLPFLTRDDFWWMGLTRHDINNWTPWILSNVIDCMLMELRDRHRLTEGLSRALRMLDRYLAVMPADGGCDEGCGYWNMAGGSLLDCLESLSRATGGKASFYDEPHIRAIAAFPVYAHIFGDYYWNFADCDAKPHLDGERLYTFGLRTQNRALMALGAECFDMDSALEVSDTPQMNRVLLSLFARIEPLSAPPAPQFVCLPDLQAFAWDRGGLYCALKGGHNGESHNHNDVGSLIVYIDGEPHIIDVGNMTYTAKTFGPERYTLWNTRSRNHNLPLIGDTEQCAGCEHAAKAVQADENGASMELQAAYPSDCGLSRFARRLSVMADGFELTDEIDLLTPNTVTWVFMLRYQPQVEEGTLHFGKLKLRFDPSLAVAVEEIAVTDPRMACNFPGSVWRVTLTAAAAEQHKQTYRITRN